MIEPLRIASRGLFGRTVCLDDVGVRRGRTLIAWQEVDHYIYDWQDWRRPGDILIVGRTRRMIRIAPIFDHWAATAALAFAALHARLRDDPCFDPFAIEQDALVHVTAGRLPLTEIEYIELGSVGPTVIAFVHARDLGEWVQVEVSEIADFWLWLELLDERGVTICSPLTLFLPPALAALEDRIGAGNRLPRAHLHRPR